MMKLTTKLRWTKTGEFKNKWYLELPLWNQVAVIYQAKNSYDWYVDYMIDTEGKSPTLAAAKQAVRRALKKAGVIE